eukprot:Nitzschia sp. Nitz4//scaffold98_size77359//54559//56250//NITZ4_005553-RA/size77359-processed-gene-0.19-mRNA-1//1//CDS//3329560772//2343//frame0
MGKRGGKRRRRATQWAEHQTTEESSDGKGSSTRTVEETVAKRQKQTAESNEKRIVLSWGGELGDKEHSHQLPTPMGSLDRHMQLKNLWKRLGATWDPTPIQQHLWSIVLESPWNAIAIAPTGSGKTLAYSVPVLLSSQRMLVLVPTRELVQQVSKVCTKVLQALSSNKDSPTAIPVISVRGGEPRAQQQQQLQKISSVNDPAVVVATPGRLLDLLKQNEAKSIALQFPWIVLDEADQLAKDGDLGPQVNEIVQKTRLSTTRLLLVSATYPSSAVQLFQEWVGPQHVNLQVDALATTTQRVPIGEAGNAQATEKTEQQQQQGTLARIPAHLEQILHVCAEHKKPRKLVHTLQTVYGKDKNARSRPLGIVFFSKIEKLKHVSKLLQKEGYASVELHSQLSTQLRESNLADFACGKAPLLLATDVAARGIDISAVRFVIQYDFPGNLQQYVHRCGRAGRSHDKGQIYSFFTRNLERLAPDLVDLLKLNNAWVDPNLKELARKARGELLGEAATTPKRPSRKRPDGDEEDEEVDDFPELAPNRIVLKRASHVSDASSSSEDEDDGDE